eukprot:CFRG8564T1
MAVTVGQRLLSVQLESNRSTPSKEEIYKGLSAIDDDLLEIEVWARDCPGISGAFTEASERFNDSVAESSRRGVHDSSTGVEMAAMSEAIRIIQICCDYVQHRIHSPESLGWPILHIRSLNTCIVDCIGACIQTCRAFLDLMTDDQRKPVLGLLSKPIDQLYLQCYTLLKSYVAIVLKFFPPTDDTDASDVIDFVKVLDCLYCAKETGAFDKQLVSLAWKNIALILSKYSDLLIDKWPRSQTLFDELLDKTTQSIKVACTSVLSLQTHVKRVDLVDTNKAEEQAHLPSKSSSQSSATAGLESVPVLENRIKLARFYFTHFYRLCKPTAFSKMVETAFPRIFDALLCLQMGMQTHCNIQETPEGSSTHTIAQIRDTFLKLMCVPVEQIIGATCAHPSILKMLLDFPNNESGRAFFENYAYDGPVAYAVFLCYLLRVADSMPTTSHVHFLHPTTGAVSTLLSLQPSLYLSVAHQRPINTYTKESGIRSESAYTHILISLSVYSVRLLFTGTDETFADRMRGLEMGMFNHVISPSFEVRCLVGDWWVYLSRRWASPVVLHHSRLLLKMALALRRYHQVEYELVNLINRLMVSAKDSYKRTFVEELKQIAATSKTPNDMLVMSRLTMISLSDELLELVRTSCDSTSSVWRGVDMEAPQTANLSSIVSASETTVNMLARKYRPANSATWERILIPFTDLVRLSKQMVENSDLVQTTSTSAVLCQVYRLTAQLMDHLPPELIYKVLTLMTSSLNGPGKSKACKYALVHCLLCLHRYNTPLGKLKTEIFETIEKLYKAMLTDSDWIIWHSAANAFRVFATYTEHESLLPSLLPGSTRELVVQFIRNEPYRVTHRDGEMDMVKHTTLTSLTARLARNNILESEKYHQTLVCTKHEPVSPTSNQSASSENEILEAEVGFSKRTRVSLEDNVHVSVNDNLSSDLQGDNMDEGDMFLHAEEALVHLKQGLQKLQKAEKCRSSYELSTSLSSDLINIANSLLSACERITGSTVD